jgi:hypothetical protein
MAFKNEYLHPLERQISKRLKKTSEAPRPRSRKTGKWMAVVLVGMLTACDAVNLKWSEEVQLNDGQVIVIKRTAKGEKQGELGGPGGWKEKEMTITLDKGGEGMQFPSWQTAYVPILLDYQAVEKTWSVVATFYYCGGWYNLNRPKLPYVQYQSKDGGAWIVVPLEERLIGRKTNLLTGPRSGGEPPFLSLEEKKGRGDNASDRFRWIIESWHTTC